MRVREREKESDAASERAKDKTGDMHLRGIQRRDDPDWRAYVTSSEKNKLTNNAVDFVQTDNTLSASFTHLFCFPPSLY